MWNWHQGHDVMSHISVSINEWSRLLLLHLSYFLDPLDFLKGVCFEFWVTEGWPQVPEGFMEGFVPKGICVVSSTSCGETKIGPCSMKNHANVSRGMIWLLDKYSGYCTMAFKHMPVILSKLCLNTMLSLGDKMSYWILNGLKHPMRSLSEHVEIWET